MDEIKVQIKYTKTEAGFPDFTDAIYYPLADYPAVKQTDIEALKTQRFSNFKTAIQNPPPPKVLTKSELLKVKSELEFQLSDVEVKLLTAQ